MQEELGGYVAGDGSCWQLRLTETDSVVATDGNAYLAALSQTSAIKLIEEWTTLHPERLCDGCGKRIRHQGFCTTICEALTKGY